MTWAIGDLHVTPIDDLREHVEERSCWCKPQVLIVDNDSGFGRGAVIVHRSADGREFVEEHGVQ